MFSQPLDNLELKTIAEVRNQSREEEKDIVRKKVKGLLSLLSKTDPNQENGTGVTTFWLFRIIFGFRTLDGGTDYCIEKSFKLF
jgi:hypothetical protein